MNSEVSAKHSNPSNRVTNYLDLSLIGLRASLDLMMMVLGAAWIGFGIAVLLTGFRIVGELEDLSTGAMLVTVLVLGLIGAFALGIASEGSMKCAFLLGSYDPIVVLLVRGLFMAGLSLLLRLIAVRIEGWVDNFPGLIGEGVAVMSAVARAGLVAAVLGSVVGWLVSVLGWTRRFPGIDSVLIFLIWTIATLFLFSSLL